MQGQQFQQFAATKVSQPAGTAPAPAVEEEGEHTLKSLSEKKIHEIRDILRAAGKRITGNKEDLIARVLGIEEPSVKSPNRSKKRNADEMGEGDESDEGNEDGEQPATKKFKVDRTDPIWSMCFLCQSKENLVKYKDIRKCSKCKAYWKGKRLLRQDAEALFLLGQADLENLPHRDTQGSGGQMIPLYAFATCAGAAVKRYGSLYHMVKSDPTQREALAQHLSSERAFADLHPPAAEGADGAEGEFDGAAPRVDEGESANTHQAAPSYTEGSESAE